MTSRYYLVTRQSTNRLMDVFKPAEKKRKHTAQKQCHGAQYSMSRLALDLSGREGKMRCQLKSILTGMMGPLWSMRGMHRPSLGW